MISACVYGSLGFGLGSAGILIFLAGFFSIQSRSTQNSKNVLRSWSSFCQRLHLEVRDSGLRRRRWWIVRVYGRRDQVACTQPPPGTLIHAGILIVWGGIACLFTSSSGLNRCPGRRRRSARSCFASTNLHVPNLVY